MDKNTITGLENTIVLLYVNKTMVSILLHCRCLEIRALTCFHSQRRGNSPLCACLSSFLLAHDTCPLLHPLARWLAHFSSFDASQCVSLQGLQLRARARLLAWP